jgi:hypothetical protein
MDIFNAASVFMFQIGARHLTFDFTDAQKELIRHPVTQSVILLSMFYMGTRNLMWSVILLVMYHIIVSILLNENNKYNMLSSSFIEHLGIASENKIEMYYSNMEKLN